MKYSQHVSQMCKLDLAVASMFFLQTIKFGNKQLIMTLHNIVNLAPYHIQPTISPTTTSNGNFVN
jgi:hypothetical protein